MSKYKKWYDNIINNAKNRMLSGYVEVHHVLPRSLGGTDDRENLVQLTAREHFICHVLLTKFTTGQDRYKMLHAVVIMKAKSKGQHRYINSRIYERLKLEYSKAKKGVNVSWNTGLTIENSEKLIAIGKNISKAMKGRRNWTNGVTSVRAAECPGEGWYIGRAPSENYKYTESHRKKHLERLEAGEYGWWNNGEINKRGKDRPEGENWTKGRLKTSLSEEFLTGKSHTRKYDFFNIRILITGEIKRISVVSGDWKKFNETHSSRKGKNSKKIKYEIISVELNPDYKGKYK